MEREHDTPHHYITDLTGDVVSHGQKKVMKRHTLIKACFLRMIKHVKYTKV